MKLWPRKKPDETRAISNVPWDVSDPIAYRVSAESAVQLIPLFACVRIIADSIASLPVQSFIKQTDGTRKANTFLPQLIFAPAARDNRFQWVHKAIVSLALRGNAYGLIVERDDLGFATMVEWLHPDDVYVDESRPTAPVFYFQGKPLPLDDVVHIPWVVMPGRVVGMSPVQAFASTIGHGISTTEYGRSWFDNGGTPPATMKNTAKTVNPDESREIRSRVASAIRSRQPIVFGSDWEFDAIRVNPEESQFIQTMKLNATQIAAIYGVPPEMVGGQAGGSLTYSTVEQNSINLVELTLRPWIVRLETAFSDLIRGREEVRFNVDAMIRTATISRYQAHAIALRNGWRSVDEIRALENLPPLPNGQGAYYATPVADAELKIEVAEASRPPESDDQQPTDEGVVNDG